ncbi:MAG: CheR family methyltransferase, partial [Planctomycetota bacterium]
CRNVLIYFDEPTVEAVVARFHRVLAPDGLLIVGAGESLHGKKTDYELVPIGRSFAYRPTHIGSHTRPSGRHAAVSLPPALASGEIEVPDGLMVPEDYDTGTYVIPPDGISGMMERERMAGSASRRDRQTPDRPAAGTMIDLDMFVADFNRGGTARQTAIDRLKKRLVSRTGSMEELLTLGNAMLEVGDTEGALDLYNRAQNLDPLSPEVHFLVGLVHKKMGARWPAIQAFRRALFLEPGFWPAAFYLAVMYQSEGMSAEALREYANTLRILESSSRPPRFVSRLARNEFQSRLADEVMTVCRARLAGGGANGRG